MSNPAGDNPPHQRGTWWYVGVGGSVLAVAFLVWLLLGGGPGSKIRRDRPGTTSENTLATAAAALAHAGDAETAKTAMQQINNQLGRDPGRRVPTLTDQQRKELRHLFGFDEDALAELDSSTFTLLDAHHVDGCLLLRDAARSLEIEGITDANGKPVQSTSLERAALGFEWVVQQVRLQEPAFSPQVGTEITGRPLPPAFVLRRGWGTPLERALVYLALLRQMGGPDKLLGCLLILPNQLVAGSSLWACGVVVDGGRELYLFDPQLGLPLPGPDGKGIATLTEARTNPAVLAQLVGCGYEVTPEKARAAEVNYVCPLSALAPRLLYLQTELLLDVQVSLAADPGKELARLKEAAGRETAVNAWQEGKTANGKPQVGATLLRRFLPPEEGGSDGTKPYLRRQVAIDQLVPWNDLPEQYQTIILAKFPESHPLARGVRNVFGEPFRRAIMDPQSARDLLLRGQFEKAGRELEKDKQRLETAIRQQEVAGSLDKDLRQWVDEAVALYAEQRRAAEAGNADATAEVNRRLTDHFSAENARALYVLFFAATARGRLADVFYQRALCKHCEAELLEARLRLQARAGKEQLDDKATQEENVRKAWEEVEAAWRRYLEEYRADTGNPAARRFHGRSEAMLGRWNMAIEEWEKLPPPEKMAGLYLAEQARKKK
jgi:hypothetical protein